MAELEDRTPPVQPDDDDRARLRRLGEEILSRYHEMAMIMERVLEADGMRSRATGVGGRLTLSIKDGAPEGAPPSARLNSYICIEVDGGAWEDPPGWCRQGGC